MVTWRLTAIAEQTPKKKGSFLIPLGTGGRTRTDTARRPLDFESSASTNSTTPAVTKFCLNIFFQILILNIFLALQPLLLFEIFLYIPIIMVSLTSYIQPSLLSDHASDG